MAVYTDVTLKQAQQFLQKFDLSELTNIEQIKDGIENSNFILHTQSDRYILTLFEKRVLEAELPWFIALLTHLNNKQFPCPKPIPDKTAQTLKQLNQRPATIVSFLPGRCLETNIQDNHCFQVGAMLAKLHVSAADFIPMRTNALGFQSWQDIFNKTAPSIDSIYSGWSAKMQHGLENLLENWPTNLPMGVCHADLFIDNVFFTDNQLTGIIDFYFACNDFWAYDIAITLLDWTYTKSNTEAVFHPNLAVQLLKGYQSVRSIEQQEYQALDSLAQGAAMRFLLTRCYDWVNTPKNALVKPKDPAEYMYIFEDLCSYSLTKRLDNAAISPR